MVRRAVAAGIVVAASVAFWSGGTADAKNLCLLARAIQNGNAVQTPNGIVYKPYVPSADDYAVCGLTVSAAAPIGATPDFTG